MSGKRANKLRVFIKWITHKYVVGLFVITLIVFAGITRGETNNFDFLKRNLEPQLFAPGVISTRDYERDGTFTPDGKAFFFTKRTMWSYFSAICVSYLKNGSWTQPEVASFSGQYSDAMPFVSSDGNRLYFASRRPVEGTEVKRDFDIWFVERNATGWGNPQHVPAPINTPNHELSPIITRNGSMYFLSSTSSNMMRAVKSGDGWLQPEVVGEPNEPGSGESSGYVDPDERFMIVSVVGRKDTFLTKEGLYPRADLYIRERKDEKWGPLQHLPAPINSNAEEMTPTVSPDGKYLLFMSERGSFTEHGTRRWTFNELEKSLHNTGNGLGDIYQVDIKALGTDLASKISVHDESLTVQHASWKRTDNTAAHETSLPLKSKNKETQPSIPQLFGENIISTSDDEFSGALTLDGKTLYFNKSAPRSYRYVIVESHLQDGKWSQPEVSPFSGKYSDSDPVLSPDGTKLFWSSDRPVDGKIKHDYDIWMVTRSTMNSAWSEPVHLPSPVNSDGSEYFASMTRDGTLYFSSDRDGRENGTISAYRSRFVNNNWTPAENVSKMIDGADSQGFYDLDVSIAPDESYIILASIGRSSGLGHFDLYIAWKLGDGWSKAIHLPPPFNTSARDYSPHFSGDGKQFFFSSERGFALNPISKSFSYKELISSLRGTLNGSGNLYEVDASVLNSFRSSQ